MLGEYVEDEGRAVDHPDTVAEGGLQLALVARPELIIEDDQVRADLADQRLDLLELALTDVGGAVRVVELLGGLADDDEAGRFGEPGQLEQALLDGQQRRVAVQLDPDEKRLLPGLFGFLQLPGDVALSFTLTRSAQRR